MPNPAPRRPPVPTGVLLLLGNGLWSTGTGSVAVLLPFEGDSYQNFWFYGDDGW